MLHNHLLGNECVMQLFEGEKGDGRRKRRGRERGESRKRSGGFHTRTFGVGLVCGDWVCGAIF